MTKEVVSVSPETSLFDAAKLLYKNRFNGLPVVDGIGALVGILTEYDLVNIDSAIHIPTLQRILRRLALEKDGIEKEFETIAALKVAGVMNDDPLTLKETATLEEAVTAFTQHHRVNPIPVVDAQKRLVGIVSRSDLVKFFIDFPAKKPRITPPGPRLSEAAVGAMVEKSVSLLEDKILLFQSTISTADQAILITDIDAKIIYANKAWERLSGYSMDEILGKHPNDLWGGHMPKEFYDKLWQTIKTEKKPFVSQVKNVKKDGTEYWQDDYITPILDEKGDIRFFMSIEPDITDKKQKDQFREEFISIIGHQLRNPLKSISWMVEWLGKSSAISDEDRRKIEEIYKENKSLASFVEDLLVLSRVGKNTLSKEKFDLKVEIEAIVGEVKQANPRVEFVFEAEGADFSLTTNKPMAMQIFVNLIYNAAEYSDKGAGKVEISLQLKNGEYIFSSHNNGPDIAEEDRPKIFSKFFRSDVAKEMKKGGTGLGLFIIKSICDNFGWQIWFESSAGHGTTFYVKMPVSSQMINDKF